MWRGALSLAPTEARSSGTCRTGSFIAKIEMAMGWRGVGGEKVGVKCGGMQRCCKGARPGVRARRSMEQVAVSTKTNRVGTVARQSYVSLPRTHD